ncbi:phosphate signaling complex protein PhoU [Lactiplantibacillus pentosus]|uniref:phosphate signaling complex protein PhoU n=1 Tax=Lactiplantibacillus pentosus TaxID=1589 RepID=UPI001B36964B|nr:phosphate signaling complex protein PhoU [Lactiplantibacillus pentosus]MBQ0836355.1 phosphate signaling complex protein PhoU [Lactiplantibacillus pentosus]
MRRLFDDELNDIDANFTEMGMMVSETIEKAVKAFIDHDRDLAQEIIDNDKKINQREVELEQKSFELIALYQPVTSDLREIVTILKAVSELERMADYARNIAHATIRVKGNVRVPEIEAALSEMGNRVRKMVEDMLAAYVKSDDQEARRVAAKDAKVGEMYHKINAKGISKMERHPETVIGSTDYLNVATYLMRIGALVTNIGEWIVYLNTGEIIELNPESSNLV